MRDCIEPDITQWESDDGLYTITTSSHPGADFYLMKKENGEWVQTGIRGISFISIIEQINVH